MKFSSALVLSGAAIASAAAVPRDAPKDYCPVVKKTVQLTWVELKVFEASKAKTWVYEDTKKKMSDSKFDSSQVYKSLNQTYGSATKSIGYATGKASTSSAKPTSSGGPYYGGSTTSSKAPFPTTGAYNGTATSTHGGSFTIKATSSSTSSSATSSATLQVYPCENPVTRVEWRNMNGGDRSSYMSAVRCLMDRPSGNSATFPGSKSRFDDFISVHQQVTPYVHSTGAFLPWHRYFLATYESVLRTECGYGGPLPWWDETQDAGNFASAPLFTSEYFGAILPAQDGQGVCVTETGWGSYTLNIGPDRAIDNPHCLSRALNDDDTRNVNQGWVDSCRSAGNYNDHRECNEYGPHAYGHNGIGAVMSDVAASVGDPVFYLHHGFVDRNWKNWQNDQWWNRVYEMGGTDGQGGTTTPDYVLTSYGIRPDAKIADVLDTEGAYLCYKYDF